MPISMQIQRQFDALHRDAQRVLTSIDNLSHDIDKVDTPSKPASAEMEALNIEKLRSNLATLRVKVEDMGRSIGKRVQHVNSQVHAQPYPFIAGAVGLGALAALIVERQLAHRK
jgi:ElaB/YqjD/DUF883 family membrane-anchored ribosome-binding protein